MNKRTSETIFNTIFDMCQHSNFLHTFTVKYRSIIPSKRAVCLNQSPIIATFLVLLSWTYQCQGRRGGGEGGWGCGHRVGILTFSKKNYQNSHHRAKYNGQKYGLILFCSL